MLTVKTRLLPSNNLCVSLGTLLINEVCDSTAKRIINFSSRADPVLTFPAFPPGAYTAHHFHPHRRPRARASMDPPPALDAAIRVTNDEAFAATERSVQSGYLCNPDALALADWAAPGGAPAARQLVINRGTFACVTIMRRYIARFVDAQPPAALRRWCRSAPASTRRSSS